MTCGERLTDCKDENTDGKCDLCNRTCVITITNAEQLKSIILDDENVEYSLANNIDLNGENWTPIGNFNSAFKGIFNGNGYVISDFKITGSYGCAGFFGYNSGTIKNLGLEDFSVSADSTCDYVAGLVAYNDSGIVDNCYAIGNVEGSRYVGGLIAYASYGYIRNCYATGDVTITTTSDNFSYAGGLVGYFYGYIAGATMLNSYATGNIFATAEAEHFSAGGLIGEKNYGTVINCYASGNVVVNSTAEYNFAGGLIGENNGEIINSYSIGNVTVTYNSTEDGNHNYVGGLSARNSIDKIINCFAAGNVTLIDSSSTANTAHYVGGVVGTSESEIINCYRCDEQIISTTQEGVYLNESGTSIPTDNLKSKEWIKNELGFFEVEILDFSSGYPTFDREVINTYVDISTKDDLINLSGKSLIRNYRLANDIDLENCEWLPIVESFGVFDGNNYRICNFKITSDIDSAGLFAYNSGIIKNLRVENFKIDGEAGKEYAGGIVAYSKATGAVIENCSAKGDVSGKEMVGGLVGYIGYGAIVKNCYSEAVVVSGYTAGGLIGVNDCAIVIDCYSNSQVYVYASDYEVYAGGLVATNSGMIANSYSIGKIISSFDSELDSNCVGGLVGFNRSSILNSYSMSDITVLCDADFEYNFIGGLVGYDDYNAVTNCYRCDGQKVVFVDNTAITGVNTIGSQETMLVLKSITFHAKTLGWSSESWIFMEGSSPILKNLLNSK